MRESKAIIFGRLSGGLGGFAYDRYRVMPEWLNKGTGKLPFRAYQTGRFSLWKGGFNPAGQ